MKRSAFNTQWTCNGAPVTLPHDAMLATERRPDAPGGSAEAYFSGGRYTYEKTFLRPEAAHVLFQFEGVYRNARVFLNGKEAGGVEYGYLPFFVEADAFLVDGENTIRVECENENLSDSRWYSGAGIYRPVWLWEGPEDAVEPESVRVSTVSCEPATIRVESAKAVRFEVAGVAAEGTDVTLTIPDAKLWSEHSPYLYTARVTRGGDEAEITFGIRKVEWSPKGLFINGQETLLRGGCLHHDSGVLGAATYAEAEYRRVKRLKEAGFNAIRSAHNPANPALLEACDALGVYVMDEAWDMWYQRKTKYDYASLWRKNYLSDLDALVARDFNHPSVILYSIGNEVSEPVKPEGLEKTKIMAEHLHAIDPSRAVCAGFNLMILANAAKGKEMFDGSGESPAGDSGKKTGGMNSTVFNLITSMVGTSMNKAANSKAADLATSPALACLDICGYNYASGRYPLDGKAHPERIIVGSETFPQTLSSNWDMVKKYPYLVGDFMWTAWDYLGEVGIGAWAYTPDGKGFAKPYPWLLADTGAFDILGDPTGEAFWASAVWGRGTFLAVQPMNHAVKPAKAVWRGTNALPSWSWKGCEGKKTVVEVYTDGVLAELSLNGRRVGRARVKNHRAEFNVRYAPGTLSASAYDAAGREIGHAELTTAENASLRVLPEKSCVKPGEVVFVPVVVADEAGRTECNADVLAKVTVENGELLGFGSANPRTEERYDAGEFTTYYGRALAVVRAGEAGTLTVSANGAKATIQVEA